MHGIWMVTGPDVENRFRGDGAGFTEFVDALVCVEAHLAGIDRSSIKTNLRVNIGDGSVDTLVEAGSATARYDALRVPSVWQYKSGGWDETEPAALKEMLQGPYLRERLTEDAALRLCVCESRPAKDVEPREKVLADKVAEVLGNPPAHKPLIFTADYLADWASARPAVLTRFFPGRYVPECLSWNEWALSERRVTHVHVPVPEWGAARESLKHHAALSEPVVDVVCRLSGPAGVGKTRFVCELLAEMGEGPQGLAIYTRSEQRAREIATLLARDPQLAGILVADECFAETRAFLRDVLSPHSKRVRAITIDNAPAQYKAAAAQPRLERMSGTSLREVLARNFPHVAAARIREIVRLTEGYVLFAADLCRLGPGVLPPSVDEYLERRFPEGGRERLVAAALSLTTHVGYRGAEHAELEALAAAVGLAADDLLRAADDIHGSIGFVGRGEFLYVTPQVIAEALCRWACRQIVGLDPERFFERLGVQPQLLERLFHRLSEVTGTEEVRAQLGRHFRSVLSGLRDEELRDAWTMRRIAALVEADPEGLLPLLRERVERAPRDVLLTMEGAAPTIRGLDAPNWGPRRYLVWLTERLAAFPEFFEDATRVLLLLAESETEQGIGNNATNIWLQLHWVLNSGTAMPFERRLAGLKRILDHEAERFGELAINALAAALNRPGARMIGSPVVAGRETLSSWVPATGAEMRSAEGAAIHLLGSLDGGTGVLRARARGALLGTLFYLAYRGHLEAIRQVLGPPEGDDEFIRLRETLTDILSRGRLSGDERHAAEMWLQDLAPRTMHDRIVAVTGRSPWGEHDEPGVEDLARDLLAQPEELKRHLDWFASEHAGAGWRLGVAVGRQDEAGAWLVPFVRDSLERNQVSALVSGYLAAARSQQRDFSPALPLLDGASAGHARTVCEIALLMGSTARPVTRALEAVSAGRLPPEALGMFVGPAVAGALGAGDIAAIVRCLTARADARLVGLAIEILDLCVRGGAISLAEETVQAAAWAAVEWAPTPRRPLDPVSRSNSYHWCRVVGTLSQHDLPRAISAAAGGLGGSLRLEAEALRLLESLASHDPALLLRKLGERMLGREGVDFYIGAYRDVVALFPLPTLKAWLEANGTEAARRLARHVPPPALSGDGKPVMPDLTRFLLERFGDDDRVFREFVTGVHGVDWREGDLAALAERDAEVAGAFLNDACPAVRRWAQIEKEEALEEARSERAREERERFERG